MFRWPKPGKAYPKQLIWDIDGVTNIASALTPLIILDSAVRHQCLSPAHVFDRILSDVDVTKPGPEAGTEEAGTASPKFGYLFPKGTNGDVYKPVSESDGNLCTLSEAGGNHELYEAVDTGEKEVVKIKYLQTSGTITEWTETRPIFTRGQLIDRPRITTMFEDGKRHLCRWSRPGAQYPKNMFFVIKNGGAERSSNLIVNSASRHQFNMSYDEKVASAATSTSASVVNTTSATVSTPSVITPEERANQAKNNRAKIQSVRSNQPKLNISEQDRKARSKKA